MRRRAFTLVELLVVIAIIGVLVGLLLPAVQAARAAARRAECKSHLKQLSLAFLNFEQIHEMFPSGGWGSTWIGFPERGVGPNQPGGWAYQILPVIEQQTLFDLGNGLTGAAQRRAHLQRVSVPLSVHHCPSRRAALAHPYSIEWVSVFGRNFLRGRPVAKNDYAANIGDPPYTNRDEQPWTLEMVDRGEYEIPETSDHTGVSYKFSRVKAAQVTDGFSNTYMLGEKYLNPDAYETGNDLGDNESLYNGHNSDLMRTTHPNFGLPRQDRPGYVTIEIFGSAHSAGFHMAMCDGSVRSIGYDIDPETHRRLGNRQDGLAISDRF